MISILLFDQNIARIPIFVQIYLLGIIEKVWLAQRVLTTKPSFWSFLAFFRLTVRLKMLGFAQIGLRFWLLFILRRRGRASQNMSCFCFNSLFDIPVLNNVSCACWLPTFRFIQVLLVLNFHFFFLFF